MRSRLEYCPSFYFFFALLLWRKEEPDKTARVFCVEFLLLQSLGKIKKPLG